MVNCLQEFFFGNFPVQEFFFLGGGGGIVTHPPAISNGPPLRTCFFCLVSTLRCNHSRLQSSSAHDRQGGRALGNPGTYTAPDWFTAETIKTKETFD